MQLQFISCLNVVTYQCDQIWRNFCLFGYILKVLGIFNGQEEHFVNREGSSSLLPETNHDLVQSHDYRSRDSKGWQFPMVFQFHSALKMILLIHRFSAVHRALTKKIGVCQSS